jgi:hypothetical protein
MALLIVWFSRIYEKPSPRRVLVISFAEHDPAYEKAVARVKN